jgi:alpha-glucosidase
MIGPRLAVPGLCLLAGLCSAAHTLQTYSTERLLSDCPGYKASNVKTSATGLTADLKLAGAPCNAYGTDLEKLRLQVTYETGKHHAELVPDPPQVVHEH